MFENMALQRATHFSHLIRTGWLPVEPTNPNGTDEHHLQIVISMIYVREEIFHQLGRVPHEKFTGYFNKGERGSFSKKLFELWKWKCQLCRYINL